MADEDSNQVESGTSLTAAAHLSALRYSMPHETVLGSRYSRNRTLVDLASHGKNILELGCADGFISRHLKERGCTVTALEVDKEAAERARRCCDRLIVYDLNRPDWIDHTGGAFDTVLCGDVLEHLVHPDLILRQIRSILTNDGRVIICLPNIAHLRVRLKLLFGRFDYEAAGILDITHLRFYTYQTARELIESAGYRIVKYYPMVGGGFLSRWLRTRLHRLFAVSMMFVALPSGQ